LAFCVLLGTSDCPAKVFHLPAHQRFDFGFGQLRNETKTSQGNGSHSPHPQLFRPSQKIARGIWILLNLSPGHFADFSSRVCVFTLCLSWLDTQAFRSAFPYLQLPGAVSLLSFANQPRI